MKFKAPAGLDANIPSSTNALSSANTFEKNGFSAYLKTVMRRFVSLPSLLFVLYLAIQLLPDSITKERGSAELYTIILVIFLQVVLTVLTFAVRNRKKYLAFSDIIGFIYAFILLWVLATSKFNLLKEAYFPPPGIVFETFINELVPLLKNIQDSLLLIAEGYMLAVIVAIPLGLIFGWSTRLGNAATYISKFIGAIPPIVYIPYGLVLLPTLRSVSVMVIFLAAFWPILGSTMSGVINVEPRIINSAKVLNVSKPTMLFRVILSAALPQVFVGCNQGLSIAFILLISAEMLGGNSGMGFYIQNNADWGKFPQILVGVIVIGIVISLIMFLFNRLQKWLLRWKAQD